MGTIGSGPGASTTTIDRRPPPAGLIVVVAVVVLLAVGWWVRGRPDEQATTTAPGAAPTTVAGGAEPTTGTSDPRAADDPTGSTGRDGPGPAEPVPWGSGSTVPRPPGTRFALPDAEPTSPEEAAARRDLRVEITPQSRSIRLGDRMDVTVSITNEGTVERTLQGPCGLPFGAWLQASVSPADPQPRTALPGLPGFQFQPTEQTLAAFRTPWLREEPMEHVSFPGDDPVCRSPNRVVLAPGASAVHHGWVRLDSPGPAWTGTSVFVNVSFPLMDPARSSTDDPTAFLPFGHVRAHIEIAVDDDGVAANTYFRAVDEIGTNEQVLAWTTAHASTYASHDVSVDVRFVDGRWVVRFENGLGSAVDANVALEATTERGTGRLIDVRELRGGVGSSLDPDTEDLDPTREQVLFSA